MTYREIGTSGPVVKPSSLKATDSRIAEPAAVVHERTNAQSAVKELRKIGDLNNGDALVFAKAKQAMAPRKICGLNCHLPLWGSKSRSRHDGAVTV